MREINLDYFAERLASWLDPFAVLESVRILDQHQGEIIPETLAVCASAILTSEKDGGFVKLAREFLQRFKMPVEVIEFLRPFSSVPTSSVWDDLKNFHFEGQLIIPPAGLQTQPSLPDGYRPIILVQERDAFVDIVMQPLKALMDMVSISNGWLEFSKAELSKIDIHLQHASSEPFGAWMDATLASYCGFPNIADPKNAVWRNATNIGYRASTLVGWDPEDPDAAKMVIVLRELEKERAAETHKPVPASMLRRIQL